MREATDLAGDPTKFRVFAAYVYAVQGECARAEAELGGLPLAVDTLRMGEVAFVLARCGDAKTDGLRHELLARRLAYPTAMVHFGRGEIDVFYDWLNRAIDERFPEPLYIGVDPVFRRERQSPRFQAALRRLGL
jgi:hypothetical protein